MGKTSIEWTDFSFNPWEGCQKIGPGCDHCYAEARDVRFTGGTHWGPGAPRRLTSRANWNLPVRWNADAAKAGTRPRVFCASLADVFDNAVDLQWRADLFNLISITPNLDWLLLTKRPGNIAKMLPATWGDGYPNVWLGCTIVNQEEADRDIPKLLAVPAAVRFLSMEPLLGPVDLKKWLPNCYECGGSCGLRLPGPPDFERCCACGDECGPETEPVFSEGCPACGGELEPVCPDCGDYMVYQHPDTPCLDWGIVGGESGPHARPLHPDWARSLRDQCNAAGVAFYFKQWGEFGSAAGHPGHLKIDHVFDDGFQMIRFGKKRAGRMLDGVEWSQFPDSPTSAREVTE